LRLSGRNLWTTKLTLLPPSAAPVPTRFIAVSSEENADFSEKEIAFFVLRSLTTLEN
jgi:hypothetical protein